MTTTKDELSIFTHASPIEVWLTRSNLEVTCSVVYQDETVDSLDVNSLSMRGAQREITGFLLKHDYRAVGRWADEDGNSDEVSRSFKAADSKA